MQILAKLGKIGRIRVKLSEFGLHLVAFNDTLSLTVAATPHLVSAKNSSQEGRTTAALFFTMSQKVTFTKPALNVQQMIELFKQRGMTIGDENLAKHYLEKIGYYRLGGYSRHFQLDSSHNYRSETSFEDVLSLYVFDRKLRLLVMDAMERIEVAVRCSISNVMSLQKGPHWYLDKPNFEASFDHVEFLDKIKESTGFDDDKKRTVFVRHYFDRYSLPELPPSWMVVEVMPIGIWSKVYSKLSDGKLQKKIARLFGLTPELFTSWLRALTHLRNVCAHHSCLWNKHFTPAPIMVVIGGISIKPSNSFYALAAVIQRFLDAIAPDSKWSNRLADLLAEYPDIPIIKMGFHADWKQLWKIQN